MGTQRVQVTKLLLQDQTTSLCILVRKVKIVVLSKIMIIFLSIKKTKLLTKEVLLLQVSKQIPYKSKHCIIFKSLKSKNTVISHSFRSIKTVQTNTVMECIFYVGMSLF